ncbi:hypothetical protein EVAR_11571_1 [Eumeta japonica]|uniref:Uncharacterized protein n=1 Tax=Eumeta variegata TaxID=151549 RepID=A0A4C1X573_EUMVA|nr:hypothetical protein EVAR_11571_1 [Eumeta japonica]
MICPLCNNEHGLPDCGEFVKLNMSENGRREKAHLRFRCPAVSKPRRGKPSQTIRNLKLAPQRVERATVAACSHLTDIAENLIYDAAAPCILIGQDNWA